MHNSESPRTPETATPVTYIAEHWGQLQPHVREAILTLVDAALTERRLKEERR